ncbi:MAG: hypothetical protein K2J51_02710 [Alistipes sp.]|nr:hypothetical protein [Alistipes sp.]
MKKILCFALLAAVTLGWSCSEDYDDSELRQRLDDIASRIEASQQAVEQLNADLETYARLVEAAAGRRVVTGVSETAGTVTITYSDGTTDVLRSGAKGPDGDQGDQGPSGKGFEMPMLKIDTADGYWYISSDGGASWQPILDASGNPVSGLGEAGAAGPDGTPGQPGKVPELTVDKNGYWLVDYRDGNGQQQLLDAEGRPVKASATDRLPNGPFMSAEVSADGTMLVLEYHKGDILEIPIVEAFLFSLAVGEREVFDAGATRTFELVQRGVAEIAIERPEGWGVKVGETSVEVTAPTVSGEGEIALYAASTTSLLKLAAFGVAVEGGSSPVVPPVTGSVELDRLYGYAENTTGGEGASAANIHHFDDGKKFNEWLYLREKNKSTTPAIVWLSGKFTKDDGRAASSPWFDIKRTSNISIYGTDDFVMENVGFFLKEARNIIIRNVYIKMPKADNGADGISMQDSENVWVDHCTFESVNQTHDYEDGSCDVTHATRAVTVSWCHFIKTQKTCLVGHSNSATADKDITVTFHHNFFDKSSSRHPRVRFGRAHVYNNFYDGCTTYGAGSAYGAMVLVEHNYFDGVALPTDICTYPAKPSGSSWVSNLQGSVAGYLYECDNEYVNNPSNFRGPFTNVEYTSYNGSKLATPYTYDDFKPTYSYVVDDASRIAEIVPSGAGVGKLPGFDKAPIAVDNGGITTTTPGTDPSDPDPVVPNPVELANGWMICDYNSASSAVAAVDGGVSITACGKFESGAQTFGYVYRRITGDFVMTAVVESYESTKTTGNQSLAGIMLTPDVSASATAFLHSMVAVGPASAYYYSHRVASGNASRGGMSAPATVTGAKAVLRLERSGGDVLLSYSLDGGATFGATRKSSFAELPETVCVGLASNSGDSKNTTAALFGEVLVDGEAIAFTE